MCRVFRLVVFTVVSSILVSAQTPLPTPGQALIIGVRAARQPTGQGPYEFTLASGSRITVPAKDVHDEATRVVRSAMATQASPSVDPTLLFVLEIQSVAPAGKSQMAVTLRSGSSVRVATGDIGDPRLTFLRTALAEAVAVENTARAEQLRNLEAEYSQGVTAKVLENWQRNQGVSGKVRVKFVVHRDGRITNIQVEESGGEVLDTASVRAVMMTRQLPPMPAQIPDKTLTVQVVFEYAR